MYQQRLMSGEITFSNYLKNICHSFQTNFEYSENLMDTNELELESEIEDDEETVLQPGSFNENALNPRACLVCLIANADTVILPCHYAQICYSCAKKLTTTNNSKHCPIWRS